MSPARITLQLDEPVAVIRPEVYGHFAEHLGSCIEDGLWVGPDSAIPNDGGIRTDVVEALKRIRPPVLRWPGGCFADDYHWEDGVGPAGERPTRVNLWWGETLESNAFGTHEFIRLCRLIGAQPYVCGNVGSGTPRELREWVEYCNFPGGSSLAERRRANGAAEPFDVRYWGVGNENWGCGGNLTPAEYATEYRRFATYLRDFGGTRLSLIACGPNGNDVAWTRGFFEGLGRFRRIDGFGAHYYTSNRDASAGTALEYDEGQWYLLLEKCARVERLIQEQRALMDEFDPERRIGLIIDEWGTWHPPAEGREARHLWQQNTLRDALVAAITLDTFNRHADKVVMANIAQTVNVLQSMLLTDGDRMTLTPTYHVFEMYAAHQGAQSVRCEIEAPQVEFSCAGEPGRLAGFSGSASVLDGVLTVSLVNPHAAHPLEANLNVRSGTVRELEGRVLTHGDLRAHNTFELPAAVVPSLADPAVGSELGWTVVLPPGSVTLLRGRLG